MPVHNFEFFDGTPRNASPNGLHQIGPSVQVEVRTPIALQGAFERAGQPIPKPVTGAALIDTGATFSAIDRSVVSALSLQPIGRMNVGGVSGPSVCSQYPCQFLFPGTPLPPVNFGWLLDCNLSGQKCGQIPLIALIGRDILRNVVLIYNGPSGSISIAV